MCTCLSAAASPAAATARSPSSSSGGVMTSSPARRRERREAMSTLTDRIAQDFASSAPVLLGGGQAAVLGRRRALDALEAKGLPSSRDENWKYANLRSLERARFVPAPPAETLPATAELPPALPGIARYVFVDGHFAPAASAALRAGVVSRTVQAGDGATMADER